MFFKKRISTKKNIKNTAVSLNSNDIYSIFGIDSTDDNTNRNELGEIIYFICLNHLTQTMSKLPRVLYCNTGKGKEPVKGSKWDFILNREPNPIYTASVLWSAVELNRLHHGNAYVYIESRGLNNYLWVLPSTEIEIYIDDGGIFTQGAFSDCQSKPNPIYYVWNDSRSGKRYVFNADEILHYRTHISFDGLCGISVKEILQQQLKSLKYSEAFQNQLFKGNLFGGKILLQYTGDLNKASKDVLITEVERYANSVGTGKFLPLPMSVEAKTLDMKLTDAEFVELNKLSALQIASCFGIKPNVLNNYDKSSYSNSETQQLDFYVNSLQPIFKMYSDEDSKKLLFPNEKLTSYFEINKNVLFELDKNTHMEILVKAVNNFILTPNEAREELGKPAIDDENADKLFGNGNLISVDMAGQGANYGSDTSSADPNNNENTNIEGSDEQPNEQK